MEHSTTRRNVLMAAGLLAALALAWSAGGPFRRPAGGDALNEFLGTWTDEKGPPGNYLRLQLVPSPVRLPPLVEAFDGAGHIHDLFGQADAALTWNFESHEPLRLNVLVGGKAFVAPVRLIDADTMLIRLVPTADVASWTGEKALAGQGAAVLKRVQAAADRP